MPSATTQNDERTHVETRIRFQPRQVDKVWRVYDTFDGSYPYQRPGLGIVAQDVSEADARAEAGRLNQLHLAGKVPARKKERQEYQSFED